MMRVNLKDGAGLRAFSAMTHETPVRTLAQSQTQRIQKNRFACPRFTRQRGKTRLNIKVERLTLNGPDAGTSAMAMMVKSNKFQPDWKNFCR